MNLPKANPRRHIMVDIETFGTGRDAAIASIGACEFDLEGKIGRTFSAVVDLGASKSPGVLNAATVYWWLQQEEKAARTALIPDSVSDCLPLGQTLRIFSQLLRGDFKADKVEGLWSNGPTFDEMILRDAYSRYEMDFPVSFRASRCCRTIFAQRPESLEKPTREGTYHNALDDAIYQAKSIAQILRAKELPLR